jgi:uncharacterized protein YybS (DUF2232 family)
MARPVTESALMAALSYLLFLGYNVPVLGGLLALFCPIPLTLVAMRHGLRRAVMSCACASVLVLIAGGGPAQAYLFLMLFGLTGLASGWMLSRSEPSSVALFKATLLLMIPSTPMALGAGAVVGADQSLEELKKQMFAWLGSLLGANPDPAALAQLEGFKKLLSSMLVCPVWLMVSTCLGSLVLNHIVMRYLAPRLKLEVPPLPNPYHARVPVWVPLAMFALMYRFGAIGGLSLSMESSLLLNLIWICQVSIYTAGVGALARLMRPEKPFTVVQMVMLAGVGMLVPAIPFIMGLVDSFQDPVPPTAKAAE